MTIEEVLTQVDELKPNQYDDSIKIEWLSKLDLKIYKQIVKTHDAPAINDFNGYTVNDMTAELIADDTYADMYIDYVFAMIDYNNQEFDKYSNSMTMFESKYADYRAYYNRTHAPAKKYYKF